MTQGSQPEAQGEPKSVRAEEAKCPGCGKTATKIPMAGWLFYCAPCDWGWGHPQSNSRAFATDCLQMARAQVRVAAAISRGLCMNRLHSEMTAPPIGTPESARDIVQTIALAIERGYTASEILDENSPIRDRIRAEGAALGKQPTQEAWRPVAKVTPALRLEWLIDTDLAHSFNGATLYAPVAAQEAPPRTTEKDVELIERLQKSIVDLHRETAEIDKEYGLSSDDAWKKAVDDELALCESTVSSFPDARAAVRGLIDWHVRADAKAAREALIGIEVLYLRQGESWNDCFERVAELFRRDTGYLRPGKAASPHGSYADQERERDEAWDAWIAGKVSKMRAALQSHQEGK